MCMHVAGVLLTAICLMIEMCEKSPDMLTHFRKVCLLCVTRHRLIVVNLSLVEYQYISSPVSSVTSIQITHHEHQSQRVRKPCLGS